MEGIISISLVRHTDNAMGRGKIVCTCIFNLFFINLKYTFGECGCRSGGLMEKASPSGGEDCGFESRPGRHPRGLRSTFRESCSVFVKSVLVLGKWKLDQ